MPTSYIGKKPTGQGKFAFDLHDPSLFLRRSSRRNKRRFPFPSLRKKFPSKSSTLSFLPSFFPSFLPFFLVPFLPSLNRSSWSDPSPSQTMFRPLFLSTWFSFWSGGAPLTRKKSEFCLLSLYYRRLYFSFLDIESNQGPALLATTNLDIFSRLSLREKILMVVRARISPDESERLARATDTSVRSQSIDCAIFSFSFFFLVGPDARPILFDDSRQRRLYIYIIYIYICILYMYII